MPIFIYSIFITGLVDKKKVYLSDEWKELNFLNRACILLVSEGLKPGASIFSTENIESVLKKLKLPYKRHDWIKLYYKCPGGTELSHKFPDGEYYYDIMKSHTTSIWYSFMKLCSRYIWIDAIKVDGLFHGYPKCCVDKFTKKSILHIGKTRKEDVFQTHNLQNLLTLLDENYPDELDYTVFRHIPCRVYCGNTLGLYKKYKDVLLKYDKEAAEELKRFNKQNRFHSVISEQEERIKNSKVKVCWAKP